MISCNTTLEQLPNRHWNNTFGTLIGIVSFLAVIENGIILKLFHKYPQLRTASNKILASVTVADWLTGLTVGPLYSAQLFHEEFSHMCFAHKIRRACGMIIMGSSLTSIVFMTVDRSRRLIQLQRYSIGNKCLYGCIAACWLLPISAALVGLISEQVHSMIILLVGVTVIVVITGCYALVLTALRRHRRKMSDKKNAVYMENERKAAQTVVIIITCYIIMLLPLFIEKGLFSFKVLSPDSPDRSKAHMFTIFLFIANSNVNPVIYTSRLQRMRRCALRLFGREGKPRLSETKCSLSEASRHAVDHSLLHR